MIEFFEVVQPKSAGELLGKLALARTVYYEQAASADEDVRKAARILLAISAKTKAPEAPTDNISSLDTTIHDFELDIEGERDQREAGIKISGQTSDKLPATITIPDDPTKPALLAIVSPDESPIAWQRV